MIWLECRANNVDVEGSIPISCHRTSGSTFPTVPWLFIPGVFYKATKRDEGGGLEISRSFIFTSHGRKGNEEVFLVFFLCFSWISVVCLYEKLYESSV